MIGGALAAVQAAVNSRRALYIARGSNLFANIPDAAAISVGVSTSMSLMGWFKPNDLTLDISIWEKGDHTAAAAAHEYALFMSSTQFSFRGSNGSVAATVNATTFGQMINDQWVMLIGEYDFSVTNLGISVNAGTVNTAALATGIQDSTNPLRAAVTATGGAATRATFGPVGYWNRILTAAEKTALYANGYGLTGEGLTPGLLSGCKMYIDWQQGPFDLVGANHAQLQSNVGMARGVPY